jgi:predicted RNase H-like nuclease
VVSPPVRGALTCGNYEDATAANGGSLSVITWQLFKKIAEVDRDIAPYWQRTVFEVHPELTFFQLGEDQPVKFSKHGIAGSEERRELLIKRLPGVEKILDARLPRVSRAQLTDAAACLWTARRIVSRAVSRIPEDPEWDALGLRMEIVR